MDERRRGSGLVETAATLVFVAYTIDLWTHGAIRRGAQQIYMRLQIQREQVAETEPQPSGVVREAEAALRAAAIKGAAQNG